MKKLGLILMVISLLLTGAAHANNRIGFLSGGNAGGIGRVLTLGADFNESNSGDIGFALAQDATGTNTNFGVVLRLESKIAKYGDIQAHAGGHLIFASDPNYNSGGSSFTLNGYVGIVYPLAANLEILADFTVAELTSTGGNSSIGLLSGTPGSGTGIGAGSVNIYSGARLYL